MDLFDLAAKITLDTSDYKKELTNAKKPIADYKKDVMSLAQTYKKQGMDMSAAMKKAYSEIDKSQYETEKTSEKTSKGFSKNWGDAADKLSGVGQKIKSGLVTAAKVGAVALTAATTAMVAFGKSSVDAGMNFDKSMSQVAATMGTTVDNIQDLRNFAMEMGAKTAFSATEAADALNYMALAGYDAETSMSMLPNVLNLAAAGGFELARASDMITDTQSALGLSIDQTSELVDKMAKAASKSNTSVEQLGDAMLTIGGTAKTLSGGTTELSTALGILADNGIKGAEGGTALRNILLNLTPKSEDAASAMELIGLKAYDAEGNMRPLQDIFTDMSNAMDGMTTEERQNVLANIFNKVDLKSVNALLATNTDRWEELSGAIDDAQGAAGEMAATQLDNLAGDITLFQSALEGAKIVMSDQLTPNLREFVQFGSSAISTLSTAFQEGGLSGAMEALGKILSDGLKMVIEKLPSVIEAGMSLLKALIDGIIQNLPTIANAALEILMALANGIIDHLPTLIPALIDVILTIVEKLTEPETVVKLIQAAFQIIVAIAQGLVKAIPHLMQAIPTIIKNLLDGFKAAWPEIVNAGAQLIHAVGDGIKSVASGAVQWGKDLIQNFINGIAAKWNALKEKVAGVAQTVKNFLGFSEPKEGPLSNFHTYAPDMVELFAKGIKDNEHLITDQIDKSFNFGNDISNVGLSANGFSNGGVNNHFGAVSINIYPHENQSADEIAEAVMFRIQDEYDRKAAALT